MPSAQDDALRHGVAHDARRARLAVVRGFLSFLDDAGVDWVALGRGIEAAVDGNGDLDLVVDPSRLPQLPRLVWRFCAGAGVRCARVLQHEWNAFNFALTWRDAASGRLELLQLDLCGDYGRSARGFLSAAELLRQRARSPVSPHPLVPSPELGGIAHLLKKVDKQELGPEAFDYLCARWRESPSGGLAQLQRFFGADAAERASGALASRDLEALRAALPALRAALYRRVRRAPRGALREARRLVQRALEPAGCWIALLGPDGAGKSTLADRIGQELGPFFRAVHRVHLRPHWLDPGRDPGPVATPHAAPARGRAASLAKLCLWWLDCNAGFLLDLYPRLARAQLVLFDRHFSDLLVDPRRYRYAGSRRLASLFCASTFQPALFVVLDAPVDVVLARKREVAREELERQRAAYLDLASRLPGSVTVDAARSADDVARAVVDTVLERLELRSAARLGVTRFDPAPGPPEKMAWTRA